MHPKITWKLIKLKEVDSTNDYAKRLILEEGALEGTVVVAESQSWGKGRRGRIWHSPKGNLYCSLILRCPYETELIGQLSFVASLAVLDTVKSFADELKLFCKWPNDVITSELKKIAGILIEVISVKDHHFAVLGIGVNIGNYPLESDLNWPATSLRAHNIKITPDAFLDLELESFQKYFFNWQTKGFSVIREEWLHNVYGLGQAITVKLPNRDYTGIFKTIDEHGALWLEDQKGNLNRIISGEVFY